MPTFNLQEADDASPSRKPKDGVITPLKNDALFDGDITYSTFPIEHGIGPKDIQGALELEAWVELIPSFRMGPSRSCKLSSTGHTLTVATGQGIARSRRTTEQKLKPHSTQKGIGGHP